MDRKSLAFSAVFAGIISLSCIPIGAQRNAAPPSGERSSGGPTSQNLQQTAAASSNQQGAQSPIQITVQAPDKSATEKAREDARQEREVAAQETIARLTRALMYVAGVQAFVTGIALLFSIRAANAAKKSADAARRSILVAHRPKFAVGPIETDGFEGRKILTRLHNGRTWITNVGVLTGSVQKFWANWFFWDILPLENPAHTSTEGELSGEFSPGHFAKVDLPEYPVPVEAFRIINEYARAADEGLIFAGSTPGPRHGSLYLVGCIKYRDEIGLRRTYFAYRYDPFHGRFDVVDHPNYNYEK